MRREDFHSQLLAATFAALRFGQIHVRNRLSIHVKYVAILNQSFDDNREPDERVFPEDNGKVVPNLTDIGVVDLLHREDLCPQWIDISVAGADEETTLLRLLCCGRYLGDESRMYYYQSGTQPFGIKSPVLPPEWREGMKIKIPKPNKALQAIGAKARLQPER